MGRNVPLELEGIRQELSRDVAASPTPPRILYHYTSAAGLRGILESRSIWLTDLRFMNDLSELQYAQSLTRERVAAYTEAHPATNAFQERFLQAVLRSISHPFAGLAVYSASFCEQRNLLSQWRAYRGQGGGYAIGFDGFHAFRSLDKKCLLKKAVYDVETQHRLIDQAINSFFAYLETPPADSPVDDTANKAAGEFGQVVLHYYYSFKHPDFSEEKEWRLVFFAESDPRKAAEFPKFRDYDGNIIPYYVASFEAGVAASRDDNQVHPFPIPEIVIGPTVSSELNESSIKALLLSICPDFEPRIKSSKIPLRWL